MLLSAAAGLLPASAPAQVTFNGAQITLGSGFSIPEGVVTDDSGNVFVTSSAHHKVQEILAAGGYKTIKTLASGFSFSFPTGIALDGSGNVYVADVHNNAVYEILAAGGYVTVRTLGSGFNQPEAVAVDASGDVFVADGNNNAVKEMLAVNGSIPASPTINTLGSGFDYPEGIAVDGNGNVFVGDYYHNAVKEILAAGGYTTVNTLGSGFSTPTGVAVDGSGNVYVADTGNSAVKEILAAGGYTTVIPLGSGFNQPDGVGLDAKGDILVADTDNNRVVKLDPENTDFGSQPVRSTSGAWSLDFNVASTASTTVGKIAELTMGIAGKDFADAGSSTCTAAIYATATNCVVNVNFKPLAPGLRQGAVDFYDGSGNVLAAVPLYGIGTAPGATFHPGTQSTLGSGLSKPEAVAVDASGNVFVADTGHNEVKEILAAGGYTTIKTLAVADGNFKNPEGVAVDGSGNVFVADSANDAVKEILAAGGYVTVKTVLSVTEPAGMAIDGSGNLFVADYGSSKVYEILAAGGYTTVNTLGSGFKNPLGVAVDGSGNVFVADTSNNAVKEILAVNGSIPPSPTIHVLGSGFDSPYGVAVDAIGDVFVADFENGAVKEILAVDGSIPLSNPTIETLASGSEKPQAVTVDAAGDVFAAYNDLTGIVKLDYATPPSVTFESTAGGATSKDSPKTVTVENIGNAPLDFSAVSFPVDFPNHRSTCTSATSLAMGGACTLIIDFSPVSSLGTGTSQELKESVEVTTNTLNKQGTVESVEVSGTETKLAATLSLHASSTTVDVGSPITLTATAHGSGATPAGSVTFYVGGAPIASPVTLANGVATLKVTLKQSHSLSAIYSGDAVYAEAKSNAVLVTVVKASTTVTLTVSPNPAASGVSVHLTAAVKEAVAGLVPSGTVNFYVSGKLAGSGKVTGGRATFSTSTITAGTHSVRAAYVGDEDYLPADSNTVQLTVTQ